MADTGTYYDNHPVTGEPGRWRLFSDIGWVNTDPNAPENVYWNERGQNYMGELGQYYKVNPNTGEEAIDADGDGRWYYSGMLGWVNTLPDPNQAPQPVGSPQFGGGYVTQDEYDNAIANLPSTTPTTNTPTTNTPATDTVAPVLEKTGMLNPVGSSWLDVLNRRGADLDSWDSYLGMFTNQPRSEMPDWTSLDSNQVQSEFNSLAGNGLFTGLSQADVYADLLKRLGFSA